MKTKRILKTIKTISIILAIIFVIGLISTAFIGIWNLYPQDITEKIAGTTALLASIFGIIATIVHFYIDEYY